MPEVFATAAAWVSVSALITDRRAKVCTADGKDISLGVDSTIVVGRTNNRRMEMDLLENEGKCDNRSYQMDNLIYDVE